MADEPVTRSQVIVLIDERIKEHYEDVNQPQHSENKKLLEKLSDKVEKLTLAIVEMKATQAVVMKFAAGGIVVWCIKQIIELIQTLKH